MATVQQVIHPLFIPKGSVRALVTLMLVGSVSYHLLHERAVSDALNIGVLVVPAYYFAHRGAAKPVAEPESEAKHPLFLPRGWIRATLIVGFVATGVVMWQREILSGNENRQTLTTLASFFAGIGFSMFQGKRERAGVKTPFLDLFNHSKAVVVLLSALLLGFFDVWDIAGSLTSTNEIAALSAISFYFGSR